MIKDARFKNEWYQKSMHTCVHTVKELKTILKKVKVRFDYFIPITLITKNTFYKGFQNVKNAQFRDHRLNYCKDDLILMVTKYLIIIPRINTSFINYPV